MTAPAWTFVLLEAASAVTLAASAHLPLSPRAPVGLDEVSAVLLAVAATANVAAGPRLRDAALLAQAAGGIALTGMLVGSAATAGGTFISCAGFLWVALWVAVFFPPRVLATALGVEATGVGLAALLNAESARTLAIGASVLVAVVVATTAFAHVVGGLRRQARCDQLTGLLNRYGVDHALRELSRRRREVRTLSLVAVDLDGLKAVNDREGHSAGDRTLAAFAAELSRAVRAGDITARIGGDEFIVVLVGASAASAHEWAERLQARSRILWSFGVAQRRLDEPFDAWLDRADRCLYAAKAAPRSPGPRPRNAGDDKRRREQPERRREQPTRRSATLGTFPDSRYRSGR